MLSRAVAGCIFCVLYEHTDNLAAPVTAHMVNNLIAFILPGGEHVNRCNDASYKEKGLAGRKIPRVLEVK